MRRPSFLGPSVLVFVLLAALALLATGCSKPGGTTTTATPTEITGIPPKPTGDGGGEVDPEYQNGDAAAGKAVFAAQGCTGCHTLSDAGATGTVGPNLDTSQPDLALVVDRVVNGRGVMPGFEDSLTDKQIADVAAYVVEATS